MRAAVARGAVAAFLVGALALPACTRHHHPSARRVVPDTTSTSSINLAAVVLPVIGGTTTSTLPGTPGQATIGGRVVDSAGQAVPGATVRAEWFVNSAPVQTDVQSGADGVYQIAQAHGGVWRVRAFRAPDHASPPGNAFFLGATEQKALDITVLPVDNLAVTDNVAPNPPIVGDPTNLAVLVVQQSVDNDGKLVRTPVPGVDVVLTGSGRWTFRGQSADRTTAADGTATWDLVCTSDGPQPLSVQTLSRTFDLTLPACVSEATTTSVTEETTTTIGRRGTTTTR